MPHDWTFHPLTICTVINNTVRNIFVGGSVHILDYFPKDSFSDVRGKEPSGAKQKPTKILDEQNTRRPESRFLFLANLF